MWSIPTRRKPIPRSTASVYFTFEVSKIKPEVVFRRDRNLSYPACLSYIYLACLFVCLFAGLSGGSVLRVRDTSFGAQVSSLLPLFECSSFASR